VRTRYTVVDHCHLCEFVGLKPNSITLSSSKLVPSSFEPDSVMEFGFYRAIVYRFKLLSIDTRRPVMFYLYFSLCVSRISKNIAHGFS